MSDLMRHSEIPAGVIFDRDSKVYTIFKIAFDRFYDGDLPIQSDVEHIGLLVRPEADAVALAKGKLIDIPQVPNCSVELRDLLGRKRFGALEDLPAMLAAGPYFLLLSIAESKHAKREHFVYFCAIKKVAMTFRRDLRVIVKDDG
jgi:hypothetical protein